MDENPDLDVPNNQEGIGSIQILQTGGDVIPGETITLSLEDAAQLIFQQQGIQGDGEGGRIQPGTYQIIAQPFVSGENNQISVIQTAGSDQLQGFEFGNQNIYLQQPSGDEDQTCARIIQLPDTFPNTTALPDPQSHAGLSTVQHDAKGEFTEQTGDLHDDAKEMDKQNESSLQIDMPSTQTEHVFEMINHTVAETGSTGNSSVQQDGVTDMDQQLGVLEQGPSTKPVSDLQTDEEGMLNVPDQNDEEIIVKIEQLEDPQEASPIVYIEDAESHEDTAESQTSTPTQMANETEQPTGTKKMQYVRKGPFPAKSKAIKKPDFSKPIKVTDHMEVVVGGKKCLLKMNPETGQLCAYPLITSTPSGKRRGRPKKTETLNPESKTEAVVETEQANSAVEGLLELSNTGPDGIRRSSRTRKKASALQDYDMLDVSSDDDAAADNAEDEVLPTGAIRKRKTPLQKDIITASPVAFPGIKKGRGRPRRYPRPEDTPTTSQIPAMIIPSGDGQSIMMAPIQGLSNLEAFQEQVRNMQIFQQQKAETVEDGTQFLNTPTTSVKPDFVSEEVPEPETDVGPQAADDDIGGGLGNKPDINSGISVADFTAAPTITSIASCAEILTTDTVTSENDLVEKGSDQPTIIQIPESLLSMFIQKKDPQKIGLKASNSQLEKFKCAKCEFQGYYEQQYQRHIVGHADDVIKCKCCPFVAFDKEVILSHFKMIHPKCICTVCDHMAEHAYIIKRHMMRHSQIGCKCEICGKVYKDQYVLKMHVKMVHLPAEVLFECTVCSKKFTRKAHLKRHLRIHDPEKPFKCPHCSYRGCERSDISKHLLIHEEPKHICDVCGKAFRHLKNKELHMKRHSGQRDYKCGVCDFYGYTFTDIRKHIERKHTDTKAYICDKCGSAFKSEYHLREHKNQQCDVFMIEQALAIATADGGTSQATIQIPSNYSLDGQHIQIDGQNMVIDNGGQITIENLTEAKECDVLTFLQGGNWQDGKSKEEIACLKLRCKPGEPFPLLLDYEDEGMALTAEHLHAVVNSQSQMTPDGAHNQASELIEEMGVDHQSHFKIHDDVTGLPVDATDLPEDDGVVMETEIAGEDADMNEELDGIAEEDEDDEEEDDDDDIGDEVGNVKQEDVSEQMLEMVTVYDR